MRLFVGLPLAEADADELGNSLTDALLPPEIWRRVPARNYHCTLQFIGEVEEGDVHRHVEHLGALASEPEFRDAARALVAEPVAPAGIGAFPAPGRPRVLILHLTDPEGVLRALAQTCATLLEPLGFRAEDRPYRPHITLGYTRNRVTDSLAAASLRELGTEASLPDRLCFPRVRLVHSTLGPGGARYGSLLDLELEASPGSTK